MSNETQSNNSNPKKYNSGGVGEHSSSQGGLCVSAPTPFFDSMHRGYFPLWRKIRDWGWYKDGNTKAVFIELLLLSNFKENYYLGHKIQRGQCVAGRKTLSASLGLSERQIRTSLKRLLSTNEITIKNCNKFSIITLNNFETYLINDQREVHQTTSKRPDIDQHMTTPYNDNNVKNVRIEKEPRSLPTIKDYFIEIGSNDIEAVKFFDHFESNGWRVGGKAPMKNWQAAARSWVRRSDEFKKTEKKPEGRKYEDLTGTPLPQRPEVDAEGLAKIKSLTTDLKQKMGAK